MTVREAQEYVLSRVDTDGLDDSDRDQIASVVAAGYRRFEENRPEDGTTFEAALDALIQKMSEDIELYNSGQIIELGPRMEHLLAAICPLWPFC